MRCRRRGEFYNMNYHGLLFIPLSDIFLVVLLSKDLDLHRLNDEIFLLDLSGIGLVTDVA